MIHALIDSDVLLDVITDRLPFSRESVKVISLIEKKAVMGYASSLIFSNLYYVLRKHASHVKVIKILRNLSDLINILNVDQHIVRLSLKSEFKDFEDALQAYSAQANPEIDVIITRNIKDFQHSTLPALTPETFLRTYPQLG